MNRRFAFSLLESPWWDGSPSRHPLRAFSLVELLVVIAIVAVLLGILLSVLGPVKRRADVTADVAHQRQVYLVLHQYMDDHDGRFPAFPHTPGTDSFAFKNPETGQKLLDGYWWDHATLWGVLLMREGYDASIISYSASVPALHKANSLIFESVHQLTFTAYAEPEFYVDPVGQPPTARQRVQRRSDVLYPSHKGVLILTHDTDGEYFDEWYDERNVHHFPESWQNFDLVASFGDGHAEARKWTEFTPGLQTLDPEDGKRALPVLNTPGGIEGRDL